VAQSLIEPERVRSKRLILEADELLSAHDLAERVAGLRQERESYRNQRFTEWIEHGGDRDANRVLHLICVVRMTRDRRTKQYVARRTVERKSKREIVCCLKRYIACKVYRVLVSAGPPSPNG